MDWASEAIEPAVRADVMATIERCESRLALGVDHTVVALAGGTGSGKSSLFNALTGTQFAVPGVARPTTSAGERGDVGRRRVGPARLARGRAVATAWPDRQAGELVGRGAA